MRFSHATQRDGICYVGSLTIDGDEAREIVHRFSPGQDAACIHSAKRDVQLIGGEKSFPIYAKTMTEQAVMTDRPGSMGPCKMHTLRSLHEAA